MQLDLAHPGGRCDLGGLTLRLFKHEILADDDATRTRVPMVLPVNCILGQIVNRLGESIRQNAQIWVRVNRKAEWGGQCFMMCCKSVLDLLF